VVRRARAAWGIAIVAVLVGAVACSVEEALPAPDCVEGDSALIVAQSVPSAEFVPCLDPLPDGWTVDTVSIDQDGTVIRFDSDRAGSGAAELRYAGTCDVHDAVAVPSEIDGAARFDRPERLEPGFREQRFYVFTGGCVWWEFDFVAGASATLSVGLGDGLELVSRAALNESIRESFIDEEL
jgi:hypothetical protein